MFKKWIDETCNQLIFPVLVISCGVTAFYTHSLIVGVLAGYFFMMICCKKQIGLALCVVFCGFFVCLRMSVTKPQITTFGPIETVLTVYPDTIKVNGDMVTFDGKISEGLVRVQYKARDEEDQQAWQQLGNWQKQLYIDGELSYPESARNRHGFDQAVYFDSENRIGTLKISMIRGEKPIGGLLTLRGWRAKAVSQVQQKLPDRLAAYCNALLFGYKDQNFQELEQLFSSSGLLHLFSISGMHVYVFFGLIYFILRRIQLTALVLAVPYLMCAFVAVFLFGGSISVIRAILTLVLSFTLKNAQIKLSSLDRFAIVLWFLLLINPKTLLQLSGQLSLLMTFLLVMQRPFKLSVFRRSQDLSLLAAPLLMHYFFELPLLGGVLTALIMPFFQFILLPLCLGLFLVSFFMTKSHFLLLLLEKGLQSFERIITLMNHFCVTTGQIPLVLATVCVCISLLLYQKRKRLWLVTALLLPLGVQFLMVPAAVTFVDVGQGDSIVLQSAHNREVYVVDTGGKLAFSQDEWNTRTYKPSASYTLIPFLKGEGVRSITGLFLTHGDADHMGDALALAEAIPIKKLYITEGSQEHPSIAELIRKLPRRTKVVLVKRGMNIGKQIALRVLYPEKGIGKNEDSLVIQAEIKERSFLLMGDLDQAGESALLKQSPELTADVLKLGHHGSNTSSAEAFVNQINPAYGIISCGPDNRYGHPHPDVLALLQQRNQQTLRTDLQGMIRFEWTFLKKSPQIIMQMDYPVE